MKETLHRSLSYPSPRLVDAVVELRRWELKDLSCIEEASADRSITEATTVPADYSVAAGKAFIERQWSRQTNGEGLSLAITSADEGRAAGLVILSYRPEPGVVRLGYWVIRGARERGYASRAVSMLTGWALSTGAVHRIEALVEVGNTASVQVLMSAGFVADHTAPGALDFPTRRADAISYVLEVSRPGS